MIKLASILITAWLMPRAMPAEQSPRVYRDHVSPHWSAGSSKFWYENELPGGLKQFVVVDAESGTREVVEQPPVTTAGGEGLRAEAEVRPSERNGPETTVTFQNRRSEAVKLLWIDREGEPHDYGTVPPNDRREMHTFGGHVWAIRTVDGKLLSVYEAIERPSVATIDETLPGKAPPPTRAKKAGAREPEALTHADSPDGQWRISVQDHNLRVRDGQAGAELPLSQDGDENFSYQTWSWSPDSKTVVAFRVAPGDTKQVHLIESSPKEGGRAVLRSRRYALPGDRFPHYELNIFDLASRKQFKPDVDIYEHEWEAPQVHWRKDGTRFSYQQTDRGHQRLRVIEVEVQNHAVRTLVDERSSTFIWTAHTEELSLHLVNWLDHTEELIYVSEQSGWRHLYLVDANAPTLKPITHGEWVIRGIDRIDEVARQVWFRASGVFPGQDPYLMHFGRVNFDGSGLVFLTEADGNHTIQFSPDRRFIIDSFSRIDAAPIHELRRTGDGKVICRLEEADLSELQASRWQAPEVFSAPGRDGQTPIWGIICRPQDFDAKKVYPVLEDIYAGPQGAFVPKHFSARERYENFTRLGFVVVKIDGMGTANRSKAFHDVCWKNLKDGGFEDRIAWLKAAARKYPYIDLSRVGVFGTSAGGQNAAAAVLFHPEFYKAAVANCGCHDNRMDKASWNEQWMGYPVGPQYAECSNIENAARLRGALFLIVGELDSNVPPESTVRFADALIKAGKDFDFLLVPGADHGVRGAAGGYVDRRVQDFFVRQLLGQPLPNRNLTAP